MKISMLSTGEEVLHGDIVDTNASWLGEQFFQHGLGLSYRSTVGDQLDALVKEITTLSLRSDVIIVNGGLGPTSDDMSAQAMADAAGVELELNQAWVEKMEAYFSQSKRPMAQSNLKQAMLPKGAEVIDNPVGTACGFSMRLNDALIMFTPGVPFEFKRMVKEEILPLLHKLYPEVEQQVCHKIYTFGLGESGIADLLQSIDLPKGFSLGYRSYMPFIEVKVFSPRDHEQIESIMFQINETLSAYVVGINQPLIEVVGEALSDNQWQLSLMEQATGGELARTLYQSEKAQQYFQQSIVDNQVEPLSDLEDGVVIATEYRMDTQADVSLASFKLKDGSYALVLVTGQNCFAQQVVFKRNYPLKSQQILLSTMLFDMLRRHAKHEVVFGEFAQCERVGLMES